MTNPTNQRRQQAQGKPERLYVQILRDGSAAAYERDPREVHDNGKPVYEYVSTAVLSSQSAEIREVLEGLATYRSPLCWCPLNTEAEPHTEACRATTVLYAKLQPGKEGKDVER